MKRILKFAFVAVVVLVVAGVAVFLNVRGSGSGAIEQWIGSQLQTIANGYLNPKLSFDDLDYQYPGTVSLKNLRLTADDAGTPLDIIGCDHATVTLAEIPAVGKPIVIKSIVLDKPVFSAVATAPKSPRLVGFSDLLRASGDPVPQAPSQPSAPADRPQLSDVFQMRLIQLIDGKIHYDPRISGTEPMTLDQINTQLDIEPTEGGWYKFDTAIARKPVFDLSLEGQLNLDSFSAKDLALKLLADLGQDKLDYLPPQLQKIIRQYEIKGAMTVSASGALPIREPAKGDLKADLSLSGANVTLGEYRIPVEKLDLSAGLKDGKVNPVVRIEALKGAADLSGSMSLYEKFDSDFKLKIAGMMLQELLAGRKEGEPMKLAGRFDAEARVYPAAPLMVILAKTKRPETARPPLAATPLPQKWGTVRVGLTEGRLIALPTIKRLNEAVDVATKIVTLGRVSAEAPTESAELHVDLAGDQMVVTDFNYKGEFIAARGKGTIGLDQAMDLLLHGGPIEKVQSMLGKEIGGAIGLVTDKILAYRVTGELGEPKVTPEIGGGVVGNGIEKVGEGIGNIFRRGGEQR